MREIKFTPHKSIGDRFVAALIDYLIIWTFFFYFGYTFGEPNNEGGFSLNGFISLVPMLFWFFITIGLEQLLGATIGNKLIGIKPISQDQDYPDLTFSQSLKRHLLDPVDMFFFGLIAIVTIKNTPNNQRVGDIWAKTIVVKNNK